MRKKVFFTIAILLLALLVNAQPKYEVRAVWLTVLGNLDWPSGSLLDGKDAAAQQQELVDILDRLKAINVNTVLLHTRIRATTIYPSDIEPWAPYLSGRSGVSPGYDALQFAIDECHKRGMELHAWVVTIPIGKWNSYGCQQLRRRYPSMVKRIGEEGYLNPEVAKTADYLADICKEITRRYDIDGIHLDYIRYPETWKGRKQAHHITRIVERIHSSIKYYKPWVKLSCSPIGKYDDLSRYSSRGWNARTRVAQDAQEWLRRGLMDQLYPMMYFAGNNFMPFAIDWQDYSYGRTIVSGLGTYMLHPNERNWPLTEVKRQLAVCRQIGIGHCHFRAKFLLNNVKGIYDYMCHFDSHPALIPPMTWAQSLVPDAPTTLWVNRTREGDELLWSGAHDRSDGDYLLYNIYASTDEWVDVNNPANLVATRCMDRFLTIPRKAQQPALHYAVTALDRYGNESSPVFEPGTHAFAAAENSSAKAFRATFPSERNPQLIPTNGKTLAVPQQPLDARLLTISDMQGRVVYTCLNKPHINIAHLAEGMYVLRSLGKKNTSHKLGYFIIRKQKHGK